MLISMIAAMHDTPPVDLSDRLRETVTALSSLHTRNTLSEGHKEAAELVASWYDRIPGVEVEIMDYTLPKGRRVPDDMPAKQVIATIPGTEPGVILLGAHLDSLNLQVDAKTGRAPGANDDASGVALGLEVCRALASGKNRHTIKFAAFTGEEQGLHGSRALAKRAKAENWPIIAMLNSDTVGSSRNNNGQSEPNAIRVFSEEGDHGSRDLARYLDWLITHKVPDFDVKLVLRRDRFGRGGDHTPFVQEGFPGVRFIEVYEEWAHQHTPDDTVENMDFDYLARVTQAQIAAVQSLANAPDAPSRARVDMRTTYHTRITWNAEPEVAYRIYWRDTASPAWQHSEAVGPFEDGNGRAEIKDFNKDDHVFAVGAEGGVPVEVNSL